MKNKFSYEHKVGHRSYVHNLSSCEIKAWKNSGLNEPRPGIAEVMRLNPVQAWIFSGFNFTAAYVVYITAMINYVFIYDMIWYLFPQFKYVLFIYLFATSADIDRFHYMNDRTY